MSLRPLFTPRQINIFNITKAWKEFHCNFLYSNNSQSEASNTSIQSHRRSQLITHPSLWASLLLPPPPAHQRRRGASLMWIWLRTFCLVLWIHWILKPPNTQRERRRQRLNPAALPLKKKNYFISKAPFLPSTENRSRTPPPWLLYFIV